MKKNHWILFINILAISIYQNAKCESFNARALDSLNNVASNIVFENSSTARAIAQKVVIESNKQELPLKSANAIHTIGLSYHIEGKLDSAISEYKKAIELRRNSEDEVKNAGLLNNIASIYSLRGDYARALSLYHEAIILKQNANDEQGVANTLNNIGIIHYENKDYSQAVAYYEKALVKRIQLKLNDDAAATYGNIGLLYLDQNDYENALNYYQKGLDMLLDTHQVCNKIYLENGIGLAHLKSGNLQLAKDFSTAAYNHALKCNDPTVESSALNSLGRINLKEGNLSLAKAQLLKAYSIGKSNNLYGQLVEFTESIYEYYNAINDSENALKYYKEYISLEDSIENTDVAKEITKLELTFLFEKEKDSLQFAQQKEILTYASHAEKQSVIQMFTLLVLGLVFVIAIILYIAYGNKQKSNKQLHDKNEIITESLNEKELLIREIHHRVKNNLQIINSMLNIQQKTTTNENTKAQFQNAQNRILAMSLVHDSLFNSNQINQIDASLYLVDLIETLEAALCPSHVSIIHSIESISLNSNLAINLGLLVNELVTNSCKYGFPTQANNGEIHVEFKSKDSETLYLKIEDNGTGYNQKNTHNSFGLNMVKSVVFSLKAQFKMETTNGTYVAIEIPYVND